MARKYSKPSPTKLIGLLEAQGQSFGKQAFELMDSKKEQILLCLQLWQTADRPSTMGRGRARSLLGLAYKDRSLGVEVFTLCSLGASITRLASIDPTATLSRIRGW